MYAWIFRHLPGSVFLRIVLSLVLLLAAVAVLFLWVFPALAPSVALLGGDPAVE
ncbi:hypothetical protein [Isoptericola sp. NPDC055881]